MAADPKAIATMVRHFVVLSAEVPFLCEDCKLPTDLGHKCRACFAKWSRDLWADIPEQHALITRVVQELKKLPDHSQRAIAFSFDGKKQAMSGEADEVYGRVCKVLAGPFEPSMREHLKGIRARPVDDGKAAPAPARERLRS